MSSEKPSFYSIIPASVRYDDSLSSSAKILYGEITALTSVKGYCWASNSYFAKLYGVKANAISKWIKQLIDAHHIYSVVDRAGGNRRAISVVDPITQKDNRYHPKGYDPTIQKDMPINTSITTVKKEYSDSFETFWAEYPRKAGKQAAYRCWRRLGKDKAVKAESLVAAAKSYALATKDAEMKYIKLASTFLGPDRHFEDYVDGTPEDKRKRIAAVPRWTCPRCGKNQFNTGQYCGACKDFTREEAAV